MEIRTLSTADAPRCAELEELLFPGDNPWPREVFAIEFSHPHTFYLGVFDEVDGEELLLAYAGMAMMGPRDDPEFEIHTIGVDPACQRRGLARLLMDQLMNAADISDGQIFLEVRTDNAAAIALYEAYGFTHQGIRRNYYRPSGADAFTMSRPSKSERE